MSSTQSFEAKLQKNRRFTERLADDINRLAGSFAFFTTHVIVFGLWILANSGKIPGLPTIDPFPYSLLTMIVSLEAIFLSIFVLMSQNRQSTIDSLREEIHLQVNEIAEREVTKVLKLVSEIHKSHFPDSAPDRELDHMLKQLDTAKIESRIEKELGPQPMVISELIEKAEQRIIHPGNHHPKK